MPRKMELQRGSLGLRSRTSEDKSRVSRIGPRTRRAKGVEGVWGTGGGVQLMSTKQTKQNKTKAVSQGPSRPGPTHRTQDPLQGSAANKQWLLAPVAFLLVVKSFFCSLLHRRLEENDPKVVLLM